MLHVSSGYDTVTVAAATGDLEALSHAPGVERVRAVLAPQYSACQQGDVISEGDTQLKAALARSSSAVTGTGVKVGILSDSWDRNLTDATSLSEDIASGDIPGTASPCTNKTAVVVDRAALGRQRRGARDGADRPRHRPRSAAGVRDRLAG